MRHTTKLLPSCSGNLGIIHLNHPKALNALTLDMIQCFQDVLTEWSNSGNIRAILVQSTPPPTTPQGKKQTYAFCAGGDVKSMYLAGHKDPSAGNGTIGNVTGDFFRQEYQLNHQIALLKQQANIPQISIWDGIVMGGGVGISVHGPYRIATERTLFAMPETSIGLFPDVGSMYWMPRILPASGYARYLALTGHRCQPEDLLYTGIATHYIPSHKLKDFETALVDASNSSSPDLVEPVLRYFHESPKVNPKDSFLAKQKSQIHAAFGDDGNTAITMEDIIQNLETKASNDNCEFSQTTLETLQKMSPTSLKVTLEGLKRGKNMCNDIGEDLHMEYRMVQHFMRPGSDFYEGIRALLIDKDKSPKWNPSTLRDVTDEMVQEFFDTIECEWSSLEQQDDNNTSKL